jgi:hypothetical protein
VAGKGKTGQLGNKGNKGEALKENPNKSNSIIGTAGKSIPVIIEVGELKDLLKLQAWEDKVEETQAQYYKATSKMAPKIISQDEILGCVQVVSTFKLSKQAQLHLHEDLIIIADGDVILDGGIFSKRIFIGGSQTYIPNFIDSYHR